MNTFSASPGVDTSDLPETVVYDLTYTDAHVTELWKHLRRFKRHRSVFLRYVRVVAALILIVLIALVLWVGDWQRWHIAAMLLGLLGVLFFSEQIDGWFIVRRWRKSPHWNTPARLTLTAEGVNVDSQLGQGVNRWAAYNRACGFADGFLLFMGPSLVYWFSHGCLVRGTPETAALLIKGNVADYQGI